MRALLLLALLSSCARPAEPAPAETAPPEEAETTGVALVELFTSEGCSSCPPADAALADLVADDEPGVLALSFHVDYWNRLGWRDPFSSAEISARQRAYAPTLDGRVYTPQAVVNGTEGFVGSRRTQLGAAVQRALATPASVTLSPSAKRDGETVTVATDVEGAPQGAVLHVALVQKRAATDVARGENGGRRLEHVHVVRAMESVRVGAEPVRLAVPPDAGEVFVAAWVQTGRVGEVLGAATAEVG